jgi:hypothetical protein
MAPRVRHVVRSLPGHAATVLALLAVVVLTYASTASMYYERWGQPLAALVSSLLPAILLVVLCLVALRWPGAGGALLLGVGVILGAWWLRGQAGRNISSSQVVFTFIVLFGPVIATACLLFFEARHRRLLRDEGVGPSPRWFARNYRYVLIAGVAILTAVVVSATRLPRVLSRVDDGFRGARLIEGNGMTLVWAPQGPGWNWLQPDGDFPSWDMIALYGATPVGVEGKNRDDRPHASAEEMERTSLCVYLDEAGTTLLTEPASIWRMPTADEIARSLTRGGENAGCALPGRWPNAVCRIPPEKETPLWAPDEPPFYYWAADEHDPANGSCVNYTGGLNAQPKSSRGWGTGFRCVKEVSRSGEG